jgi:dethiobiotin synthetase
VNGTRPDVVVLVVGTGTEVGKTWVSARLLEAWRDSGLTVAARKPVQSFEPGQGPTDADILAAASGEEPTAICASHRWYEAAMAPPMAADLLGLPSFTVAELVRELAWPPGSTDVGLVESAGGVRSPLADDGDGVDLLRILAPDAVILVADAGLGTINGVRLAIDALGGIGSGLRPVVYLNRFDPEDELHRRNRDWLSARDGSDVVVGSEGGLDDLAHRLGLPH